MKATIWFIVIVLVLGAIVPNVFYPHTYGSREGCEEGDYLIVWGNYLLFTAVSIDGDFGIVWYMTAESIGAYGVGYTHRSIFLQCP